MSKLCHFAHSVSLSLDSLSRSCTPSSRSGVHLVHAWAPVMHVPLSLLVPLLISLPLNLSAASLACALTLSPLSALDWISLAP